MCYTHRYGAESFRHCLACYHQTTLPSATVMSPQTFVFVRWNGVLCVCLWSSSGCRLQHCLSQRHPLLQICSFSCGVASRVCVLGCYTAVGLSQLVKTFAGQRTQPPEMLLGCSVLPRHHRCRRHLSAVTVVDDIELPYKQVRRRCMDIPIELCWPQMCCTLALHHWLHCQWQHLHILQIPGTDQCLWTKTDCLDILDTNAAMNN